MNSCRKKGAKISLDKTAKGYDLDSPIPVKIEREPLSIWDNGYSLTRTLQTQPSGGMPPFNAQYMSDWLNTNINRSRQSQLATAKKSTSAKSYRLSVVATNAAALLAASTFMVYLYPLFQMADFYDPNAPAAVFPGNYRDQLTPYGFQFGGGKMNSMIRAQGTYQLRWEYLINPTYNFIRVLLVFQLFAAAPNVDMQFDIDPVEREA